MIKSDIQEFLLGFSAVFGIVMGMGFIFIGFMNSSFMTLLVGFILAVTGLFSAIALKEN